MATVIRTTVVKTVSDAQFAWAFNRGMIWEDNGRFFSKKYEYYWINPYVDRSGKDQGGCWEVLESTLMTV